MAETANRPHVVFGVGGGAGSALVRELLSRGAIGTSGSGRRASRSSSPTCKGWVGTGGNETLDLRRTSRKPGVQVRVKRNLTLPRAGSR